MNFKRKINVPWLFNMAWRDSRKNRSRLFLFTSSIIFGIAALVAIYSFGYNLRKTVDEQAATLIGADLAISGNRPADSAMVSLLDSLGHDRSEQRTFVSMVFFPKSKGIKLVQVRALQGGFPYYGSLETTPVQAGTAFRTGKNALVDKTLMLQFNVHVNDSVKVGNVTFLIAGVLTNAPGQTGISSNIAPLVYIPLTYLEKTGLSQKGSRISYSYFYHYPGPVDMDKLTKRIEPQLDKQGYNYDTIETRKESTGRSFGDLARFLSLVGFIALLLGCIGVASAIHIYVREKIASVAIMRCLGVKAKEAFLIYLIQIAAIGLIGSVIGAALGSMVQQALPLLLKDFLPFSIASGTSWPAIGQGIILGLVISVLFALLSLISVRNISPLNTLRLSYEDMNLVRDPLRWLVYFLILLFIVVFSYLQLNKWLPSLFFTFGILLAFLLLTLVAWILMNAVRLLIRSSWSYLWRQGFANLYRPNNQTMVLIVSIGLSTALICTLFFIQQILIRQVTLSGGAGQPNMILFDIQSSQQAQVSTLTRQQHLPVLQQVPIVTIRLEKINGKTAADIKKDSSVRISRNVFNYEYRVTYRDTLSPSETITAGTWTGHAGTGPDVPVSIEESFSKRAHLAIGDHLLFNVQGSLMPALVSSIRKVNWGRVQTNFQIVFPKGALEDAPQFHVLLTHVPSVKGAALYQQAVVKKFPNISIVDLGQVISTLDELLEKIGYIIRFMSAFSIITGLVVLIASVRISKYQRIKESVLLRTLGASRKQILAVTALEYIFLGLLSSLTGILIAVTGSWLLARYSFEAPFKADFLPAVWVCLFIIILTVIIGLFNSRGVLNKPPLEVLRNDT